jgi:hypothetical protein
MRFAGYVLFCSVVSIVATLMPRNHANQDLAEAYQHV